MMLSEEDTERNYRAHTHIKNRRAYPHGRARSYANNKFSL